MLKKIFIIGLMCSLSQVAMASYWLYTGYSSEFKGHIYIDVESVEPYDKNEGSNHLQLIMKMEIPTRHQKMVLGKFIESIYTKVVIDCNELTIFSENSVIFDNTGEVMMNIPIKYSLNDLIGHDDRVTDETIRGHQNFASMFCYAHR